MLHIKFSIPLTLKAENIFMVLKHIKENEMFPLSYSLLALCG